MPATTHDLELFHQFALERVQSGGAALELDELVMLWYDAAEREEINAAIRQGLAEIDAGLGRPAADVMAELSRKHGLSPE